RIDSRGARVGDPIGVAIHPDAIAAGAGSIWVAGLYDDEVTRIDAASGRVLAARIRVGDEPDAIATGGGSVWVANLAADTVTRIDAATGAVAGDPIHVGSRPDAIVATPGV